MDKDETINYALTFEYGGMLPIELSAIYDACKDKKVLELGSMVGMSSYVIASVAKELHCIDVWSDTQEHLAHDPKQAKVYQQYLPKLPNMFGQFKQNCEEFIDSGKITMHRGKTQDLSDEFLNGYFDILFIDADHSYEGVSRDFGLYYTKINSDGRIVFHDYRDSMWTGIEQFCKEMMTNNKMELISSIERVAVFKLC